MLISNFSIERYSMATRFLCPLASRIGIASELRKVLPNMLQIELYGSRVSLVQSSLFRFRFLGTVTYTQDVGSKVSRGRL